MFRVFRDEESEKVRIYREALKNVPKYQGRRDWIFKVDRMPEHQVIAVYLSFLKRNMWDKDKPIKNQIKIFEEEQIEMDLSSLYFKGGNNAS